MSVAGSTDNNMESLVDLHHKEMVSKKNDSMGEWTILSVVDNYI